LALVLYGTTADRHGRKLGEATGELADFFVFARASLANLWRASALV